MRKTDTTLSYIASICSELETMAKKDGAHVLAHLLAMARIEAQDAEFGPLPTIYRSGPTLAPETREKLL